MELISTYLKSDELSLEQKRSLKSLRQKGYDKKSKLRRPNESLPELPPHATDSIAQQEGKKRILIQSLPKVEEKFIASKFKQFQMDFSKHTKQIFMVFSATIVGYLLWLQSVGLYKSSGFENPGLVAFTGIIMVIGFSIYHAHARSWLALVCCIYIGAYETYFIASGTFSDEKIAKVSNPEIQQQQKWHMENISRAKEDYEELKKRYDDPENRIFQNTWFKKKHLDPAWEVYSGAQKNFTKFESTLLDGYSGFDHVGWLKVLFRLGLVGLFMMTIHQVAMWFTVCDSCD